MKVWAKICQKIKKTEEKKKKKNHIINPCITHCSLKKVSTKQDGKSICSDDLK